MTDPAPLADITDRPDCVHHWLLADAENGEIAGRCLRCGGHRSFPAHPEPVYRFQELRERRAPRTPGRTMRELVTSSSRAARRRSA